MSDANPRDNENMPWSWHPAVPIENSPLFTWPARPLKTANYVLGKGFLWSPQMLYVLLAILTWLYFGPALDRCVEMQPGWTTQLYLINLVSVITVAGGLQLYLYTFNRQGMRFRIDPSPQARNNSNFFYWYSSVG